MLQEFLHGGKSAFWQLVTSTCMCLKCFKWGIVIQSIIKYKPFVLQVLVRGLTICVQPDMLKKFLQHGGKQSVSQLVYGLQSGVALCVFQGAPGEKSII